MYQLSAERIRPIRWTLPRVFWSNAANSGFPEDDFSPGANLHNPSW